MCVRSIIILLSVSLQLLVPRYFGGKATSESIRRKGKCGPQQEKRNIGGRKEGRERINIINLGKGK